jgi:hypothetical protein
MITIREISDNKSNISSTRWAFATVIIFDIIMIAVSVILYCTFYFLKKPLGESFFYAVGTLLGILTTLVSTPKMLQGFEPNKNKKTENDVSETTTVEKTILEENVDFEGK